MKESEVKPELPQPLRRDDVTHRMSCLLIGSSPAPVFPARALAQSLSLSTAMSWELLAVSILCA